MLLATAMSEARLRAALEKIGVRTVLLVPTVRGMSTGGRTVHVEELARRLLAALAEPPSPAPEGPWYVAEYQSGGRKMWRVQMDPWAWHGGSEHYSERAANAVRDALNRVAAEERKT